MNFKSHLRVSALMLGLSLCSGLLTSAHAAPGKDGKAGKGQDKDGRGGKRGGGMKMMEALNLTDAQKAELKPILEAQREQMKALRADTTLSPKDKKAKMKAIHAATEAKVNSILTPAQQKTLADMKAKRKAEREANGKDGKDGAGRNRGKDGKGKRGGPQAPAPTL